MLEPENSLISLTAFREDKETSNRRPGRPKKSQDSVAEERNADLEFLQSKNLSLRRNLMNGDIEYIHPTKGLSVIQGDDLNTLTHLCAFHFGETIPEMRMKNAVLFAAQLNAYDPVKSYLEECVALQEPSPHFDSIAERYLGNTSPIANESLKRLITGMVARAYVPGSPLSFLPILQGAQGLGKSLFSSSLVPAGLFAEISTNLETIAREQFRLHRSWLIELGEIDRYFVPSKSEDFKNLITIRVDEVRLPYQLPSRVPRRFGFIGTTNQSTFLCDSTGNRRFVPISIEGDINIDLLLKERDALWAAAVVAYRSGMRTEFTSGELASLSEYQDEFMEVDTWADQIHRGIAGVNEITTAKVLTDTVGVPLERQNTTHRRRVAAVLREAGWTQKNTTRKGRKVRLWINPDPTVHQVEVEF